MKRDTKKLILDAAEALFADSGFDAVSIREITGKAGVRLALANYHFTSKQGLLEAVIARRADLLNERRRRALSELQARGQPTVEEILEAFIRPHLEFRLSSESGWKHYSALIAHIVQSNRWLPLVETHFNTTAMLYRDALCTALPDASKEAVLRAFVFSIQLMVSALAENRRIDTLSHGSVSGADLESTYRHLLRFLVGGFQAVVDGR